MDANEDYLGTKYQVAPAVGGGWGRFRLSLINLFLLLARGQRILGARSGAGSCGGEGIKGVRRIGQNGHAPTAAILRREGRWCRVSCHGTPPRRGAGAAVGAPRRWPRRAVP